MTKFSTTTTKILATLALGGALMGFAAGQAAAATLNIGGNVPGNCVVTVTPDSNATSLTLTDNNSATAVTVGVINEKCNDPQGYKVDIGSANATTDSSNQAHMDSATTSDTMNYTIVYDTTGTPIDVVLTGGDGVMEDVTGTTKPKTGGGGVDVTIGIKYDGTAYFMSEATYTDVITITLQGQ